MGVCRIDGSKSQACLLKTKGEVAFSSRRIDKDHPDMLLNEFGVWPFAIGE